MFKINSNSGKDSFLKQAEDARQKRQLDKKKIQSAIKIQSLYRGYHSRKHLYDTIVTELTDAFLTAENSGTKQTAPRLFDLIRKFFFIENLKLKQNNAETLNAIFVFICKYLIVNVQKSDLKTSYVSLIVSKVYYQNFISQSNKLIGKCVRLLNEVNLREKEQAKNFDVYLNVLVVFTFYQCWKCFETKNNKETTQQSQLMETILKQTTLSYMTKIHSENIFQTFNKILMHHLNTHNLFLTPSNQFSILNLCTQLLHTFAFQCLEEFCANLLTVPGLVRHFIALKNETHKIYGVSIEHSPRLIKDCDLTCRLYALFSDAAHFNSFINKIDFIQSISLLGNLCTLEKLDLQSFQCNVDNFIIIANLIFDNCAQSLEKSEHDQNLSQRSETITWNPLFGYLKIKTNLTNSNSLLDLLEQLRFLWSHEFVLLLFDSKTKIFNDAGSNLNVSKANVKDYIRNIFDKTIKKTSILLNTNESVYRICSFYRKILILITEPKIEILSALSIEEEFLFGLWRFVANLGPICGLKDLIKILERERRFEKHPIFDVLFVLSSLILYLLTIFDENEIYLEQKILSRENFKQLALFLNHFLYEVLAGGFLECANMEKNSFFALFQQLLIMLYDKEAKQGQCDDFWIVKEIRIKHFVAELEKERPNFKMILEKMPHVISLKHRIEILQGYIAKDKSRLHGGIEGSSVRIKIRRNKLIEDGINQIGNLPPHLLKSTIRVVFINELGLNEAGIDQDGVFKEFLIECIKKILNPEFNLFQVTSEQQLYPSPCSYFIEDHLVMFEFVGKLIGKAIYEGHVIDIEFAPFFLRQIIGFQTLNYSFLDDLATLDKELYKNLKSIKHDECVSDLELTFTHSELHLGKLVTNELVPSGNHVKVNNENKIRYIHLLSHFKLHRQIREQVNAFNKGFKSIIKQEWLNYFTLNEVQKLISGSTIDLNLEDLKVNVQYWGGLHGGHRLVKWLWEILENDFDREERGLFLKFVTSTPKPPLLGFSSLNPPFTIRCVEVDEEDGTIYDASFKGFFKTMFNIGRKDSLRLPTSSTCFNLLKLPNYSQKSTLRDKLRYAIRSNAGFELS